MLFIGSFFLFYLLSIIITWCLGYFLIRIVSSHITSGQNQYSALLIECFIGYLFISSITALIATRGNSVMWLVFIGLTSLLFSNRVEGPKCFVKPKRSKLGVVLIIFTFFLSFFSFVYLNNFPNSIENIVLNGDFSFYGKLSKSLIETGEESNMNVYSHFIKVQGNEAYHYGDLWYTSVYSKLFSISSNIFLMFGSYPILFSLGIIGLMGLFKNKTTANSFLNYITIIVLILGCSITLPFEFEWYKEASFLYKGIIGMETKTIKTLILFPLVVLVFTFLDFKNKFIITSILIIGMGAYSSVVPAFTGFGFSFLFFGYLFRFKNDDHIFSFVKDKSILLFAFAIIFTVIYGLTTTGIYEYSPVLFEITKYEAFISSIEHLVYPYLMFPIVTLGLVFLAIISVEKYFLTFILLLSTSVSSIVYIMMNIFNPDVNQVLLNLSLPLFVITSVYIYSKAEYNHLVKYSCLFILVVSSCFNLSSYARDEVDFNEDLVPSNIFRKKVMNSFTQEHSNWVMINKNPWWNWRYSWIVPGGFIMNNKHSSYPLDISKVLNGGFIPQFEITPFSEKGFTIESFLTENKFDFLYSESEKLVPLKIKPILKKMYVDHNTGNVFYMIRK